MFQRIDSVEPVMKPKSRWLSICAGHLERPLTFLSSMICGLFETAKLLNSIIWCFIDTASSLLRANRLQAPLRSMGISNSYGCMANDEQE